MNYLEAKEAVAALSQIEESEWFRSDFVSIWRGPDLELLVVQCPTSEAWEWTCLGWRTPDDADNAKRGWVSAPSRKAAEIAAMKFYLSKE
jgi:hypothetical protein